jgi:4-amino-4-deoxy-L-arabinose transferase-like glycosyltransferase
MIAPRPPDVAARLRTGARPVPLDALRCLLDPARTSEGRFLAFVLICAALLRTAWIAAFRVVPVSDFALYFAHGADLAVGLGYVDGNGAPTAYFPIGYPAFLGLLFRLGGPSILIAQVANLGLALASLALFHRLAQRLLSRSGAARLATLILAAFPSQVAYVTLLSDSILFQCLLLATAERLSRGGAGAALAGGFWSGLAVLTRPYALLLPLLALRRTPEPGGRDGRLSRAGRLGLALLAMALVVSPWMVRNARLFDEWVPIATNSGVNLLIGNGPGADGRYTEAPLRLLEGIEGDESERDRAARAFAWRAIREHPLRFVTLGARKLYHAFADDAQALRWNLKGRPGGGRAAYGPAAYAGMAFFEGYYLVVLLSLPAYFLLRDRRRLARVDGLALLLVAGFALLAIVFFGNPRFHYPVIPWLCLYAGALAACGSAARRRFSARARSRSARQRAGASISRRVLFCQSGSRHRRGSSAAARAKSALPGIGL